MYKRKYYSVPLLLLPVLVFLTLLVCQSVKELRRGGVGPRSGQVGLPPWSDLPLNRVLSIHFSIFAYSSNIFITNLDLMGSILALGTLRNTRFVFSSSSFCDRAPAMKLTCSTILVVYPSLVLHFSTQCGSEGCILFFYCTFITYYITVSDV